MTTNDNHRNDAKLPDWFALLNWAVVSKPGATWSKGCLQANCSWSSLQQSIGFLAAAWTNPSEKICASQKWIMKPQGSEWRIKIFEANHHLGVPFWGTPILGNTHLVSSYLKSFPAIVTATPVGFGFDYGCVADCGYGCGYGCADCGCDCDCGCGWPGS